MTSLLSRPRFVVRTIRNGRIRLDGRYWEPGHTPCPPRFNGLRAAFSLYWISPNHSMPRHYDEKGMMDRIALWGSEFAYRGGDDWPGPFCEDNVFKWEWWRPCE